MRLQDDEHDGGYIHKDERVEQHPCAGFVVDAVAQEMHNTRYGKYAHETHWQHHVERQYLEVCHNTELCQLAEML